MRVHQGPGLRRAQQRDHRARREAGLELRGPAGVRRDGLDVIEQRFRSVHLRHIALQAQQLLRRQRRDQGCEQVTTVLPEQQLPLEGILRIAELDAHQEPVELRFGKREGADLVHRVLRRDDEERLGHRIGVAVGRDLVLLHRLEQRALRLGRGAIDLVGQHELCEHRPSMEAELAALGLEHRHADDVCGQQVARKLDPLVDESERTCERMRERGLAHAGDVLDQQVTARQQAGE